VPRTSDRFGDEELLAQLRAGDDLAFARLVHDTSPRLLAVARRILKDEHEAQDAVQESYLAVVRELDGFEGRSRLSSWLYRVTVNNALMRLRKRKRLAERSADELQPEFLSTGHWSAPVQRWSRSPEDAAADGELRELLFDKIAELPPDYRDILLLRDVMRLDTAEASEQLGITTGAAKVRLHRARKALRELLDPHLREEAA
jgi:RNA polymerase sigma-70 factor, ECF subfamily